MPKFEVGKTYRTNCSIGWTVVAIHTDGRLICDCNGSLVYRSACGKSSMGKDYDLIDPDEITQKEEEVVLTLLRTFAKNYAIVLYQTEGTISRAFKAALTLVRENGWAK